MIITNQLTGQPSGEKPISENYMKSVHPWWTEEQISTKHSLTHNFHIETINNSKSRSNSLYWGFNYQNSIWNTIPIISFLVDCVPSSFQSLSMDIFEVSSIKNLFQWAESPRRLLFSSFCPSHTLDPSVVYSPLLWPLPSPCRLVSLITKHSPSCLVFSNTTTRLLWVLQSGLKSFYFHPPPLVDFVPKLVHSKKRRYC